MSSGEKTTQLLDNAESGASRKTRKTMSRVGGYLLRGLVSGGALGCAGLIVASLSTVGAPLPDRGLANPIPAAMAAPAALPDVPEPAAQLQAQPATLAPPQAAKKVTIPLQLPKVDKQLQHQPQLAFAAWAARMSGPTGIPQRALEAYALGHAAMATSHPNCHLTWVTLAGIGMVESQHGTMGGRTLLPSGYPSTPIVGVPLNGAPGVKSVADTDGGLLDGDKIWDHAVGPFQFIPSSWAVWRADAHGDGKTDPQNIDNAALAAAQYLCADNRNLGSGDGWLRAILSYNSSLDYVRQVYGFAQGYARSAQSMG
ncbi:MAG: lytic transglycosylase domain-containing protein [Pseudonocardiaceae bacterium]